MKLFKKKYANYGNMRKQLLIATEGNADKI